MSQLDLREEVMRRLTIRLKRFDDNLTVLIANREDPACCRLEV